MLRDIGYDDQPVADLLVNGVQVVGRLEELSSWPPADNGPKCSVPEVEEFSNVAQKKPREHTARGIVTQEVWRQTVEEVDAGLLDGPCTDEHLAKVLGDRWTGARRFGRQQGEKIRSIDDFSEFQVNSGFGASSKIVLLSLEEVVSRARAWKEAESDGHLSA